MTKKYRKTLFPHDWPSFYCSGQKWTICKLAGRSIVVELTYHHVKVTAPPCELCIMYPAHVVHAWYNLFMWQYHYGNVVLYVSYLFGIDTTQCTPDSKVHGANMGPTLVLSVPDGPHVGPMNLSIKDITSTITPIIHRWQNAVWKSQSRKKVLMIRSS